MIHVHQDSRVLPGAQDSDGYNMPAHMALPRVREPVGLERHPHAMWGVAVLLAFSLICAALQLVAVQPYLWPAGDGLRLSSQPPPDTPLPARPPVLSTNVPLPIVIDSVAPDSPAERAGLARGDRILEARRSGGGSSRIDFSHATAAAEGVRLDMWRQMYWAGVRTPLEWRVATPAGESRIVIDRPAAWNSASADGWTRVRLGDALQTVVFSAAAVALFALRSRDLTAWLSVLALALSALSGGGPLRGEEALVPGIGRLLTIVTWMAAPFAFPVIALAIMHFPSRSQLVVRHPWVQAVPFVAAAPMIVPSFATALYLTGVDAAAGMALWDAAHPGVFYASAATALALNVAAVVEGVFRYRLNHDANERRRIRMALYTAVPGILGYAAKDGAAIAAGAAGVEPPVYGGPTLVMLHLFILLPAFGLVYAVGVARVLGPRVVLRRSLQYALANRTLTVLALMPAGALVLSLLRDREMTIRQVATGSSGLYLALIGASLAAFRYRERARQWLDQRFFREEYDARKILLSLATRVRFETDPADLASVVVQQIDEALHPETLAILVSGVEEGRMVAVCTRYGNAAPLPLAGGLTTMLRWSDEPLEIFLQDPRSPAKRLPPDEQEWLASTGAVLLVPVVSEDRTLIAIIALGARRSEEAYTAEDLQLLASIATQMGLGFDVARLRRSQTPGGSAAETTRMLAEPRDAMNECPRCGRCEDGAVSVCPADGTALRRVASVPRVVDGKYRIEQLLGRGGMGAVYRARDIRLDRLVAVKVVRAELLGDPDARRRFRREAQIVAKLHHPSIVAIFDYGTFPDGGAFLVMEFVRGEDLRRVLLREGRIDALRAARILTSVCGAIEAAHREGVLHRDLKPENILLPGDDADAKVLDFGVAKLVTEDRGRPQAKEVAASEGSAVLTADGTVVGTPAYMAPEQFHGMSTDARTDVFSLGVIAYEMLSGTLPFGRGTFADVVVAQSRGVPALGGDVSPALERAVRAALERDADRRPATPQALAHLINAAIGS
jgi:predicted Ser/Thr protein kinase